MGTDREKNEDRLNDFLERYAKVREERGELKIAEAVRRLSIPRLPFLRR